MVWPSPSMSSARSRSARSSSGGTSPRACRFTGFGAQPRRVRARCSATPPAARFRAIATKGRSTSTCSSDRSATNAASTSRAHTWSISPDRHTPSPAPKGVSSSWCGSAPTRSSTTRPRVDSGWHAAIDLGFEATGGTTHLARRAHRGPLVVQRPFRPEGPAVCHVYLLHPPGGLVGGDGLVVDVGVDAGAHALVTTPAASKVYRTNGEEVRQTQRLRVAGRGALEWLPQEAILYDGARATLETR